MTQSRFSHGARVRPIARLMGVLLLSACGASSTPPRAADDASTSNETVAVRTAGGEIDDCPGCGPATPAQSASPTTLAQSELPGPALAPEPEPEPEPEPAPPPAPEPPSGPRFNTTIGSASIDGVDFVDVRASCGMFEVMALLASLADRMERCEGRARIVIDAGHATGESLDGGGACLVRAARRARFGALSCTLELSTTR